MIRPVEARISQLWGGNPSYYQRAFGIPYHNGVDYAAPMGTPILSISDGYIAYTGYDHRGYGHYVRVFHPQLLICSFYAHLETPSPGDVGDVVPEGARIGDMGSTGNSTGPHLHFEVRLMIDARKYDISPYQGIARGRINPETMFALMDRVPQDEPEPEPEEDRPLWEQPVVLDCEAEQALDQAGALA